MKRLFTAMLVLFSASIFAAFDNTDPSDLLALQTELLTDPISMGYNLNGAVSQIVRKLNDPSLNVGGDAVVRPFDVAAMLDALEPSDFDAQQTDAGADVYTHTLVSCGCDISGYKTKWRDLFAANSATVSALDAQTTPISRAVVLFGVGSNITENDVALALSQ